MGETTGDRVLSHINLDVINQFDKSLFVDRQPYPYYNFSDILDQDFFEMLRDNWPDKSHFGLEEGVSRKVKGQRPHDRYYMSFSPEVKPNNKLFPIQLDDLPLVWREFVSLMHNDKEYRGWLEELLGNKFKVRYDWHMTPSGKDVSPHTDSNGKVGSHLFYMVDKDWHADWGGETYALGENTCPWPDPEIGDFDFEDKSDIIGNKSFLFKNTPNAWHAVDYIRCPETKYRKLVSIVCLK